MRIGISTLMIQAGKTGVAQYVFSLLRGLAIQGSAHQFTVFVLKNDLPLFGFLDGGMEIVAVPEKHRAPVKNILWHQQRLPPLAREHALQILHVPSYRRLLGRKPCRLVATIHDLAPFHVRGKYDWKRMFYGKVVVRWLARRQDRIIAVSRNTAQDLVRFFRLPEHRIDVVHNGIDHERFRPSPVAEAKTWLANEFKLKKPFFLYVARLEHPGKNHLRLIAAYNRFKTATGSDWQLVFAGSDWHGAGEIHFARKASPFNKDIVALGFIGEPDLPKFYAGADAFVYPSLFEGFGLPPLEAMACGCPVICSPRGALGEIVGDAARIIDPEDVSSIASELARVATQHGLRQRLTTAGIARANEFDWSRTARQTLEVYEKVAG